MNRGHKVAVFGCGKIGSAIIKMLGEHEDDYKITAIDNHHNHSVMSHEYVTIHNTKSLAGILEGKYAVINAGPHDLNMEVAHAALQSGCHYLDLSEDVETTDRIRRMAIDAQSFNKNAYIPQCGLAPGFVSILAAHMIKQFDEVESLKIRVGALPKSPTNGLGYNLNWSTEGLINEYCQPCEALVDGKLVNLQPLEGLEELHIDGVQYEAFNTSGGVGTLCSYANIANLNYKTIRYPGHQKIMKVILHDLNLRNWRSILVDILNKAIPSTKEDVVLIYVSVKGFQNGKLVDRTVWKKIYSNEDFTAIQWTTASSVCAVLDMLHHGMRGFIRQEDLSYDTFLNNRFGQVYR